jgi:hypothetical protein
MRLESNFSFFNQLYSFLERSTLEWHMSAQHDIDKHSNTPHIALHVILSDQHFRSTVFRRSASSKLVLSIRENPQTPINDLHDIFVSLTLHQDVLGLYITVGDLVRMDICESFQDFVYNLNRQFL